MNNYLNLFFVLIEKQQKALSRLLHHTDNKMEETTLSKKRAQKP